MSEQDLTAVQPILDAMPASEVDEPDMPVANAAQEANDLWVFLEENPQVHARLTSVGLNPEALQDLSRAVGALREAQSRWTVVRGKKKSAQQKKLEADATAFKLDVLAACRWNLRKNDKAMSTLAAITEGEGVADLVQDLSDLAMLMSKHPAAFEADKSFDAGAAIERARSLAADLPQGTSEERVEQDKIKSKDLRDKAYTHLSTLVADVRGAGRYAFRGDERQLTHFQSRYLRRRRARYRNRQHDEDTPVPVASSTDTQP